MKNENSKFCTKEKFSLFCTNNDTMLNLRYRRKKYTIECPAKMATAIIFGKKYVHQKMRLL
jgi:hypothetical protein